LWINTNAVNSTDPAGMKLVGNVTAFNSAYTLQGQNIALTGGQPYYIEARWREGTGGDGFGLAMRAQADGNTPPIYESIPGSFFRYPTNQLATGPIGIQGIVPNNQTLGVGDQAQFYAVGISGAGRGMGGGVFGSGTVQSIGNLGLVWMKNGTN